MTPELRRHERRMARKRRLQTVTQRLEPRPRAARDQRAATGAAGGSDSRTRESGSPGGTR